MANESGSLENVIFQHGTLFDLDIGRWAAQKRMRANDLLMDGHAVDAFKMGHKRLLPEKADQPIKEIESRARSYLMNRSTPFPIGGGRFVARHILPEVLERLREMQGDYARAVGELVENYDHLREHQIAVLDNAEYRVSVEKVNATAPDQREAVQQELAGWLQQKYAEHRSAYPTRDDLRSRFRFEWRMFNIEPSSGIQGATTEQQEEMIRARESLRQEMNEWVRQATAEMHRTLGEAAMNAHDLLVRNGKLNPKNLKPLFEAFEAFRAMDFTGASEFQAVVDRARAAFVMNPDGTVDYKHSSEEFADEAHRDSFRNLLTEMGRLSQEAVAEEAGIKAIQRSGSFARVVDI